MRQQFCKVVFFLCLLSGKSGKVRGNAMLIAPQSLLRNLSLLENAGEEAPA